SYGSASERIAVSSPSDGVSANYSPLVLPGNVRRSSSSMFSFPDVDLGAGAFIGPNAQITVVPQLSIHLSSSNVVVTWPTSAVGFALQYSTNFYPSSFWSTNLPPPV